MSTITKLNPEVRQMRAMRRNAVRSLRRMLSFIPGDRRFAAALLDTILVKVSRNPARTGAQKDITFARLMRSLAPTEVAA